MFKIWVVKKKTKYLAKNLWHDQMCWANYIRWYEFLNFFSVHFTWEVDFIPFIFLEKALNFGFLLLELNF